jgi:hypothetical protein
MITWKEKSGSNKIVFEGRLLLGKSRACLLGSRAWYPAHTMCVSKNIGLILDK